MLNMSYAQIFTVTDHAGRSYSRGKGQIGGKYYFSITNPMGNTTRYFFGEEDWSVDEIKKVEKPLLNVPVTNTFDKGKCGDFECGLVKTQTDAHGNVTTLSTNAGTVVNAPDSSVVRYRFYGSKGAPSTLTDGTNERFTYNSKGNVLTRIDQAGKTWNYTYNDMGQVLTAINPSGGVATNTYNNDGTLASTKDSDTGTTTYTYDVYKRPITVTLPGGATIQTGYNLNDQITSITDENNNTYTYDANGNLTNIKDSLNNNTQYAYDLMDRVSQITDRLNKTTITAYNNMGKLQTITDPNNLATSYTYEARGWANSTTIGGQTWQTSYNDEGIPATNTTPMNRTTVYLSNNLGLLTSVTNPLN